MRFTCAIACMLVAIRCVDYGNGGKAVLFSVDALWLWHVIAAAWAWNGVHVLFRGTE